MKNIKVAIVGVGNCANALLQGIEYYGSAGVDSGMGLVRPDIGGYRVGDIQIVAAFDVTVPKVGKSLAEAAWAFPNETFRSAVIPPSEVMVSRGLTFDGIGKYLRSWLVESEEEPCDVIATLRESGAEVVVNYLPVGSEEAAQYYARAALEAGCAFVNCIPVFLASADVWQEAFAVKGLPIIGDDIKSQVGATIVHRILAQLFRDRGVKLLRTLQLNIGGNGDFLNMLERERLASKKTSKTQSVISVAGADHLTSKDIHIGPSDYVEWLGDRKWAYMRLEGLGFGGAPLNLELKLEVWDSPNSAGIVIDAIRCAKLALDRKLCGALVEPAACFMKSPPVQFDDSVANAKLAAWINGLCQG